MQLERSPYTGGEKGIEYICWGKIYFKFKVKDYQIGKFLPNDKRIKLFMVRHCRVSLLKYFLCIVVSIVEYKSQTSDHQFQQFKLHFPYIIKNS